MPPSPSRKSPSRAAICNKAPHALALFHPCAEHAPPPPSSPPPTSRPTPLCSLSVEPGPKIETKKKVGIGGSRLSVELWDKLDTTPYGRMGGSTNRWEGTTWTLVNKARRHDVASLSLMGAVALVVTHARNLNLAMRPSLQLTRVAARPPQTMSNQYSFPTDNAAALAEQPKGKRCFHDRMARPNPLSFDQ